MSRTRGHGHHSRKNHEWTAPWHRLRHQEPSTWAAYEAESKLDLGPAWTRVSLAVAQTALEPGRVDPLQMALLVWKKRTEAGAHWSGYDFFERPRHRTPRKFCVHGEATVPESTPDPTRDWTDVTEDDIAGWGG